MEGPSCKGFMCFVSPPSVDETGRACGSSLQDWFNTKDNLFCVPGSLWSLCYWYWSCCLALANIGWCWNFWVCLYGFPTVKSTMSTASNHSLLCWVPQEICALQQSCSYNLVKRLVNCNSGNSAGSEVCWVEGEMAAENDRMIWLEGTLKFI